VVLQRRQISGPVDIGGKQHHVGESGWFLQRVVSMGRGDGIGSIKYAVFVEGILLRGLIFGSGGNRHGRVSWPWRWLLVVAVQQNTTRIWGYQLSARSTWAGKRTDSVRLFSGL